MSARRATALALLLSAAAPQGAAALVHRVELPPPPPPRSLSVDLDDSPAYVLRPTRRRVAAGTVRIRVYNRGMDDHDLTVVDARGRTTRLDVIAGAEGVLEVDLARGPVRLTCSLFDHASLGMRATIRAARS